MVIRVLHPNTYLMHPNTYLTDFLFTCQIIDRLSNPVGSKPTGEKLKYNNRDLPCLRYGFAFVLELLQSLEERLFSFLLSIATIKT